MNAAPPGEKPATLNMQFDPLLRQAVDAYIADHNSKNEHKASIRSATEAAFKLYLGGKGFWPYTPPKKARA
jgi:hypothetical protein